MNREQYEWSLSHLRLPPEKLRSETDPKMFSFETTADLKDVQKEMIGQERAEKAMDFGLTVKQNGYNLFVVGPSGTGRMTYTENRVKNMAKKCDVPNDWCYVYNFENPDRPVVISFPRGEGQTFQRKIEQLLLDIEQELKANFSSDVYEKEKRSLVEQFRSEAEELWKEADEFAKKHNMKIERTQMGVNTIPLRFGRPMSVQEYEQLTPDMKETLEEKEKLVAGKIEETVYQIRKLEDKFRKNVHEFMIKTASYAVEHLFEPLKEEYKDHEKVQDYLKAYFEDIVEHYSYFLTDDKDEDHFMSALVPADRDLNRYKVNLLVNNKQLDGAPVIYETNPTYSNLFGKVEYQGQLGSWVTDFTLIKPGALHLANGGYLILQATELLQHPYAWSQLKRALQLNCIQIESSIVNGLGMPASGMKPEPIPLDIKVIIIGSYYIYDLLSTFDEDFHKLFKVKVEFNTLMDKDEENRRKMAHFIKTYSEEENLLPFHRRAVAKVIDYSSRLIEHQEKLTTRFHDITKVLVESSYWAQKEGKEYVDREHIEKALKEKANRSNYISERYREMFRDGTIMVDTDGYRVGQINGLAVMGTRDATFGIPTKITAQTYVGKRGIMNIEREAALSGQIHHKGMMILTGFLSGTFAQDHPIPLSASITFEQTYTRIDGDSASSTELYVLLSSLANVPIYQGIAVTGSVNQWGEIQPIGGVNEKIEGFYYVCKERGLTGNQGVIIPKQNEKNLMLDEEVVEAVRKGDFHIWSISHIAEGIEILTGVKAGHIRNEKGEFPEGTIFAKVDKRFKKMYEGAKQEQK